MKDNTLYNQYLKPGNDYFVKSNYSNAENYELEFVPSDFSSMTTEKDFWLFYQKNNSSLPLQGWKIHISTSYIDIKETLKKVSTYCFANDLPFKHLKNSNCYVISNSKNASRNSSGKFITIYPSTFDIFIKTLRDLEEVLKGMKPGPYILSDKRWKNTNIFYRYGAFVKMINEYGELCIKDDSGNFIKDERNPYYICPEFMKSYDKKLDEMNTSTGSSSNRLDEYEILSALAFSNAGGVYVAIRKNDNKKVIIKEARPNAGLDGDMKDALFRQETEFSALEKLKNIDGIVRLVDRFKEWEHFFLVEEYIEGLDLKTWLSLNYPFFQESKTKDIYYKNAISISKELFSIVEQMHEQGVSLGDIQPANIMITDNSEVNLIDFETAIIKNQNVKPNLMTMGFSSVHIKNGMARDWFGVKKVIKYLFLPIINSEELDIHLEDSHKSWLVENLNKDEYSFYSNIIKKCDYKIIDYSQSISPSYSKESNNISLIKNRLIDGLVASLNNDSQLIHGDIRQYEIDNGFYSYLFGGTGAGYVLMKNKKNVEKVKAWVEKYLLNTLPRISSNGLLDGRAGNCALLHELNHHKLLENELDTIFNNLDSKDYTLRSGLSGIGLLMISAYINKENSKYFEMALSIEEKIDLEEQINLKDWSAVNRGLIDGQAGVALFYCALYKITLNKEHLVKAKNILWNEAEYIRVDEKSSAPQLLDNKNRLLPYLSGGSIGLSIAMYFYKLVSNENVFDDNLADILNLAKIRSTVTGGLFEGAGSFLLIPDFDKKIKDENVISLLNLFIIQKDNYYRYAGQFSYRLSDDVFSGSSGIILALMSIEKGNPLYWLPLIEIDKFMEFMKN